MLVGCGHRKVVVAPEVRTELIHDSIFIYDQMHDFDSTYTSHVERINGDTLMIRDTLVRLQRVFVDKVVEKDVESVKEIEKPYPVEVVKEVRKRNTYDRLTARGFWALLAIFIVGVWWNVRKWF